MSGDRSSGCGNCLSCLFTNSYNIGERAAVQTGPSQRSGQGSHALCPIDQDPQPLVQAQPCAKHWIPVHCCWHESFGGCCPTRPVVAQGGGGVNACGCKFTAFYSGNSLFPGHFTGHMDTIMQLALVRSMEDDGWPISTAWIDEKHDPAWDSDTDSQERDVSGLFCMRRLSLPLFWDALWESPAP